MLPLKPGTVCRFEPPIEIPARRYVRGNEFGDWAFRFFAAAEFRGMPEDRPGSLIFVGRDMETRRQYRFYVPLDTPNRNAAYRVERAVHDIIPVRTKE